MGGILGDREVFPQKRGTICTCRRDSKVCHRKGVSYKTPPNQARCSLPHRQCMRGISAAHSAAQIASKDMRCSDVGVQHSQYSRATSETANQALTCASHDACVRQKRHQYIVHRYTRDMQYREYTAADNRDKTASAVS